MDEQNSINQIIDEIKQEDVSKKIPKRKVWSYLQYIAIFSLIIFCIAGFAFSYNSKRGCEGVLWNETDCQEKYSCTEWEQESCISLVEYYIPVGYQGKLDVSFPVNELCYDFLNDPDNVRGEVSALIEQYPNNWSLYLTTHKTDPSVVYYSVDNLTEPYYQFVKNWTKDSNICLNALKRK